jgi:hypothetical protein
MRGNNGARLVGKHEPRRMVSLNPIRADLWMAGSGDVAIPNRDFRDSFLIVSRS